MLGNQSLQCIHNSCYLLSYLPECICPSRGPSVAAQRRANGCSELAGPGPGDTKAQAVQVTTHRPILNPWSGLKEGRDQGRRRQTLSAATRQTRQQRERAVPRLVGGRGGGSSSTWWCRTRRRRARAAPRLASGSMGGGGGTVVPAGCWRGWPTVSAAEIAHRPASRKRQGRRPRWYLMGPGPGGVRVTVRGHRDRHSDGPARPDSVRLGLEPVRRQ